MKKLFYKLCEKYLILILFIGIVVYHIVKYVRATLYILEFWETKAPESAHEYSFVSTPLIFCAIVAVEVLLLYFISKNN